MFGYVFGFYIVKDCVILEGEDIFFLLFIDVKEILNKVNIFYI